MLNKYVNYLLNLKNKTSMKKLCFALAALLTMSFTSQAQQVKIGAKAGMNLSRFTETFETMKPGFHGGVYAQIKLAPMFSIQPEVLYSMQGATYEDTDKYFGQTLTVNSKITSHNLIVPIMLQFTPIKPLTIEAGPQFGFNLGMSSLTTVTTTGILNSTTEEEYIFESDDYNTFDFALAAGLKFNATKNINVYARYVFGLTEIAKDLSEEVDDKAMNQNLMIGVGFSF